VFEDGQSWQGLGLTGRETIAIRGLADLRPRQKLAVEIAGADGKVSTIEVLCRIDTEEELGYYRNGGILPFVLRNLAAA
jgi:aconitate hydratase